MKNLVFSLFAIALAGVAAIAATTAMLNTPVHNIGPPPSDKKAEAPASTGTPPAGTPAPSGDRPAAPASVPDADKPAAPSAGKPAAPEDSKPAGASTSEPPKIEPEGDVDPYEGIAPEDLPPDLQYDADSSVSFPTNT